MNTNLILLPSLIWKLELKVWLCGLKDYQESFATVNDLINVWGFYVILGVQAWESNRQEAFKRERLLLSWLYQKLSTKVICFRQKYQENLKIVEYPSINNWYI